MSENKHTPGPLRVIGHMLRAAAPWLAIWIVGTAVAFYIAKTTGSTS